MVHIKGFAAVYNQISNSAAFNDGKRGIHAVGAFSKMLDRPCTLQISHDDNAIQIASVDEGTLKLYDCPYGLAFEATINTTTEETEWLHRLKSYGCSLGDITDCIITDMDDKGQIVHRIESAIFSHVALVTLPAYGDAICWNANSPIPVWNKSLMDASERWEGYVLAAPEPAPEQSRKRPVASVDAIAREHEFQALLKTFGGNPHRHVRPPSNDNDKGKTTGPTTMDILLQCTDEITDRLLSAEVTIAALDEKQKIAALDETTAELTDRLRAVEMSLNKLDSKLNGIELLKAQHARMAGLEARLQELESTPHD